MYMTQIKLKTLKKLFFFFLLTLTLTKAFSQSAVELAQKLQCELFYEPISKTISLSKNNAQVTCKVDQNILVLNNTTLEFYAAPYIRNNVVYFSQDMAKRIEAFFLATLPMEPLFKVQTILIDPGHGGKDPGAIGTYIENGKEVSVYEKTVVLKTAKELATMLEKTFPDKNIIMTRKTDTYPTLEERVEMANNVKLSDNEAIIYISIHANSSFNKTASGFEVWYLPRDYKRTDLTDGKNISNEIKPIVNSMLEEEFNLESILLANNILENLKLSIGDKSQSRGLKEQAWFVVRNAKMPAVLIELGFVSNNTESKLLNSDTYLKKCAEGIYNGIVQFVTQFETQGLN